MSKLILNPNYGLYEQQGQPFCDSLQVAETFEKQHKHVLRDIENIFISLNERGESNFGLTTLLSESGESNFGCANFIKTTYRSAQNKKLPKYLMTKDGFTLLAMGFTGAKAMSFKIAYIERFNEMEKFIKSSLAARLENSALTDAIFLAYENPKHYHFSNELDMINRIVLGVAAKQFRESHGLTKGNSIRPYLSLPQIQAVECLQRTDIGLLVAGLCYEERKSTLQSLFNRMIEQKLLLAA